MFFSLQRYSLYNVIYSEIMHTCLEHGNCRACPKCPRPQPSRGPLSVKRRCHFPLLRRIYQALVIFPYPARYFDTGLRKHPRICRPFLSTYYTRVTRNILKVRQHCNNIQLSSLYWQNLKRF